jgi:hypothetical protein
MNKLLWLPLGFAKHVEVNMLRSFTTLVSATVSATVSVCAFAETAYFPLPEGSLGVSPLEMKVSQVRELCPQGVTCITNGTVVTLLGTLQGCGDVAGPFSYNAKVEGDTLKLYVSATNIVNKFSLVATCLRAPQATIEITHIPQVFPANKIEVINLNNIGTVPTTF